MLAIGAGLALWLVWDTLIRMGRIKPGQGVSVNQANTVRIENYLFPSEDHPVVFVGSSLMANLRLESRLPNCLNLGLSGASSLTGLTILGDQPRRTQCVVVEVSDTVSKGTEAVSTATARSPFCILALKALPSLRQQYSPFDVLFSRLKSKRALVSIKTSQYAIQRAVRTNSEPWQGHRRDVLYSRLLDLKTQISKVSARGVTVLLLQIPQDDAVMRLPRETSFDALVDQVFPQKSYRWLHVASPYGWKTLDGLHMVPFDADRFSELLAKQVRSELETGKLKR